MPRADKEMAATVLINLAQRGCIMRLKSNRRPNEAKKTVPFYPGCFSLGVRAHAIRSRRLNQCQLAAISRHTMKYPYSCVRALFALILMVTLHPLCPRHIRPAGVHLVREGMPT